MMIEVDGVPVVTQMNHLWVARSLALPEAYMAARRALDVLVEEMRKAGVEMDQGEWLDVVREMAASNVYGDVCGIDGCDEMTYPLEIESEDDAWLECRYCCSKHGWHRAGWSATLPFMSE